MKRAGGGRGVGGKEKSTAAAARTHNTLTHSHHQESNDYAMNRGAEGAEEYSATSKIRHPGLAG